MADPIADLNVAVQRGPTAVAAWARDLSGELPDDPLMFAWKNSNDPRAMLELCWWHLGAAARVELAWAFVRMVGLSPADENAPPDMLAMLIVGQALKAAEANPDLRTAAADAIRFVVPRPPPLDQVVSHRVH